MLPATLNIAVACNVFIAPCPPPVDHDKRPDFTPLIKASQTVGMARHGFPAIAA